MRVGPALAERRFCGGGSTTTVHADCRNGGLVSSDVEALKGHSAPDSSSAGSLVSDAEYGCLGSSGEGLYALRIVSRRFQSVAVMPIGNVTVPTPPSLSGIGIVIEPGGGTGALGGGVEAGAAGVMDAWLPSNTPSSGLAILVSLSPAKAIEAFNTSMKMSAPSLVNRLSTTRYCRNAPSALLARPLSINSLNKLGDSMASRSAFWKSLDSGSRRASVNATVVSRALSLFLASSRPYCRSAPIVRLTALLAPENPQACAASWDANSPRCTLRYNCLTRSTAVLRSIAG